MLALRHRPGLLIPLAAALALAGCGEAEEPTYETDVVDESGGELIVTEADSPAVEDVQVPETPMNPVPAETATAEPAAE